MAYNSLLFRRLSNPVKHILTASITAILLLFSGCVTGIIQKPDLGKLVYDKNGVLKYDGKEVEIRETLPWYKDIWPDSPAEWGFALFTAGLGAAIASGGSGGNGDFADTTATTTTTTSSSGGGGGGSSSSDTTTTTTTSSGGGGGGGGGGSTTTPALEIETPD